MLGHLLNNHPNMSVAHEFQYAHKGMATTVMKIMPRHYINNLICDLLEYVYQENQLNLSGRLSTGYFHPNFGETNPCNKQLLVIGDKRGGGLSNLLKEHDPNILKKLTPPKCALRLLHVIRNPFDIIATMSIRNVVERIAPPMASHMPTPMALKLIHAKHGEDKIRVLCHRSLEERIEYFFSLVDSVQAVKQSKIAPVLDIHYHEFLQHPEKLLRNMLEFLGLEGDHDYYTGATANLKPAHKSRHLYPDLFSKAQIETVTGRLQNYAWLSQYRYID